MALRKNDSTVNYLPVDSLLTEYGSDGDDVIKPARSTQFVFAGGGDDTIILKSSTIVSGGAGADRFEILKSPGVVWILDFDHTAGDIIDLSALDIRDFAHLKAITKEHPENEHATAGLRIVAPHLQHIGIDDYSMDQLDPSFFVFAKMPADVERAAPLIGVDASGSDVTAMLACTIPLLASRRRGITR